MGAESEWEKCKNKSDCIETHGMRNGGKVAGRFPHNGNVFRKIFHTMEAGFGHFSTQWKRVLPRFSTVWKNSRPARLGGGQWSGEGEEGEGGGEEEYEDGGEGGAGEKEQGEEEDGGGEEEVGGCRGGGDGGKGQGGGGVEE